MCGIIGFITKDKKDLTEPLIRGLVDLEYRGYDSAGIAWLVDKEIVMQKCLGAPSEYLIKPKNISTSTVGIGHNRWATHGKPSIQNAHPHFDCNKNIAVVHNGTILNYKTIKKDLQQGGHVFQSETDTEVVPHLIEKYMKGGMDIEEAIRAMAQILEGSFGLVILHTAFPHKLFVVKNGSPISIGKTDDSYIVASSTNALVRYTESYITLDDGEMAILDRATNQHHIYKYANPTELVFKVEHLIEGIELDNLSKGEFATFMEKEIFEQPATTRTTLLGRTDIERGNVMLGGLTDYLSLLSQIKNIYLVGCGSAYNATLLGKEIIERLTPINVSAQVASEFRYRKQNWKPEDTIMLSVSQSGETADTLEAIKEMNQRGFTTFGMVNVVGSAIAQATVAGVYTRAGAEIGVASTKAFTSQCTTFYLLALLLARMHEMQSPQGMQYIKTLEAIPSAMIETLTTSDTIKKITAGFTALTHFQFLGRGIHMSIAHEGALKFKELTYLEAGSYPLGELKHGPMAMIDQHSLSIVLLPKDELFSIGILSLEQIKAKGGRLLVITDEQGSKDPSLQLADECIVIPTLPNPLFYPLLEVIPLQLLSYHFANHLGKNIDKPRNLAKSVTVQ